jgi:hypothetical protein
MQVIPVIEVETFDSGFEDFVHLSLDREDAVKLYIDLGMKLYGFMGKPPEGETQQVYQ